MVARRHLAHWLPRRAVTHQLLTQVVAGVTAVPAVALPEMAVREAVAAQVAAMVETAPLLVQPLAELDRERRHASLANRAAHCTQAAEPETANTPPLAGQVAVEVPALDTTLQELPVR